MNKLFSVIILIIQSFYIIAQVKLVEYPLTYQEKYDTLFKLKEGKSIQVIANDSLKKLLNEQSEIYKNSTAFAMDFIFKISFYANAEKIELKNSGKLYLLKIITVENAPDFALVFNKFKLPEGSKLFIYNQNKTQFRGPYTSYNNQAYETFTTGSIKDNIIYIEYFEPTDAEFQGILNIGSLRVSFIKNTQKKSAAITNNWLNCHISVDCEGDIPSWISNEEWNREINSVCLIAYRYKNSYDILISDVSSGVLLNNSDANNETPILLTALHNANTLVNFNEWYFMFNYHAEICDEPYNDWNEIIKNEDGDYLQGAEELTRGDIADHAKDYLLLRLNAGSKIIKFEVDYAGWDASDFANSTDYTVGIHHPAGYTKMIARDDRAAKDTGAFWIASFDQGAVANGSSGSPLFNDQHQVIGICLAPTKDPMNFEDCYISVVYLKFSEIFDNNSIFRSYAGNKNSTETLCPFEDCNNYYASTLKSSTVYYDKNYHCKCFNNELDRDIGETEPDIGPYCPQEVDYNPSYPSGDVSKYYIQTGFCINNLCDEKIKICHDKKDYLYIYPKSGIPHIYLNGRWKMLIYECDDMYNVTQTVYSKWFRGYIYSSGYKIDINKKFDITLKDDKKYKIRIEDKQSSGTVSAEKSIYIMPKNITYNNNFPTGVHYIEETANFTTINSSNTSEYYTGKSMTFSNLEFKKGSNIIFEIKPSLVDYCKITKKSVIVNNDTDSIIIDNYNVDLARLNENITIYPNPNSGYFTFHYNDKSSTLEKLELTDLNGAMLWKLNNICDDNIQIDVTNIPDGMYLLKCYASNRIIVSKVLIIN